MWEGYPYFPLRKEFPLEGLPSNMPDVAFTAAAPLEGGPFVTVPSTATTKDREPRARGPHERDLGAAKPLQQTREMFAAAARSHTSRG
jgi:hypothetical protein